MLRCRAKLIFGPARFLGKNKLECSSTGNTSSSLAMYAALAGCKAYVYVPDSQVSENKINQTLAYGAEIIRITGKSDYRFR
jgi:threonine synthase